MKFRCSLNQLINYTVLSFITTFLLLLYYYKGTGSTEGFLSLFYAVSIPSYYFLIVLALNLLMLPFCFFKYTKYLFVVPKIILDLFLLSDILVFNVYRFHIDLLFIDMAIHDYQGIGMSSYIVVIMLLLLLVFSAINIFIFYISGRVNIRYTKYFFILFLVLLVGGQMISIWAIKFRQDHITKYNAYFPYYFPTTSTSLMTKLSKKYPFLIPENYHQSADNKEAIFQDTHGKNTLFNYPINQIQINDTLSKKYNILFFVVESWRFDRFKKEITPNIYRFAQKSYVFNNHYSGGNVTITGLFSLMYGLHPSYMSLAQSNPEKYQTVFNRALSQYGYDTKVYVSQNFDRFSLKTMFFNGLPDENYTYIKKNRADEIDSLLTDKIVSDIEKDTSAQPWFKFLFLSSSHFHYNYPPAYKIFTPLPKNSEGFIFDKNIDAQPYLNDYSNSLYYEDALFQKIINSLETSGQLDNTIVLISSDHGEEFNDNKTGFWGHGSNFTRYQTSTPLIVHVPGQTEKVVINKKSSHIDVVPTILKHFLKCKNPISDYSNGYDLFELPDKRSLIISSYVGKCYFIDSTIYSTGIKIRSYNVLSINKENKNFDYKELYKIKQEEMQFIK